LHSLGADVNAPNRNGATQVFVASQNGHEAVVRLLLSLGADATTRKDGWTPLMAAVMENHPTVVAALLQAGADRNARLTTGQTMLAMAAGMDRRAVVRLLSQA
jgi:ankyrin repeat protein